jgi:xyloglucan:xyloglucosyl transferase
LYLPDCLCYVSGSGFASRGAHLHGFFSASIKLPADHTAGVVVAFYVSTG